MTGRERVKRALHFKGPDRVPFWGKGSVDFTPEVTISPNPHWVMPYTEITSNDYRQVSIYVFL